MLGAVIVVGVAAGLIAGRLAAGRACDRPRRRPRPLAWGPAKAIAVLACAALAAAWMVPTLGTMAAGMDRADSLWYHMPLAARFVQTGYLGHIYFFDPVFFASFYPANSEVLHAVAILFFDRDIVSPMLNLGWLAVALLAAWCIGRPYGVAPQALIGASVALGSQILVEFQAGEALNDITGVAFILAAAAILVNGYAARRRGRGVSGSGRQTVPGMFDAKRLTFRVSPERTPAPPSPACHRARGARRRRDRGRARGGVKLSFLAPVAALTVGVMVIASADHPPAGGARCRDPDARRRRLLVRPQPDRGRQPDPLRRLDRPDLPAGSRPRLPAAARLRGRSTTGTTPTCGDTGSRRACTSRSGRSGR